MQLARAMADQATCRIIPEMSVPNQIGIKATTNEKLGSVGREEGIAAYAVALLIGNLSSG